MNTEVIPTICIAKINNAVSSKFMLKSIMNPITIARLITIKINVLLNLLNEFCCDLQFLIIKIRYTKLISRIRLNTISKIISTISMGGFSSGKYLLHYYHLLKSRLNNNNLEYIVSMLDNLLL